MTTENRLQFSDYLTWNCPVARQRLGAAAEKCFIFQAVAAIRGIGGQLLSRWLFALRGIPSLIDSVHSWEAAPSSTLGKFIAFSSVAGPHCRRALNSSTNRDWAQLEPVQLTNPRKA